jgi:transposase-like protein
MRTREKLTPEERVALALELIKRERSLEEISARYRVSHTTAYKIRNAFLEGGRAALSGEHLHRKAQDLEARVEALEELVGDGSSRLRSRSHDRSAD